MNLPIDISVGQFLVLAALVFAGGVAFGITIGINLYARHGK